jgi:hypothetical protein
MFTHWSWEALSGANPCEDPRCGAAEKGFGKPSLETHGFLCALKHPNLGYLGASSNFLEREILGYVWQCVDGGF